jgi:hypothetical protein
MEHVKNRIATGMKIHETCLFFHIMVRLLTRLSRNEKRSLHGCAG